MMAPEGSVTDPLRPPRPAWAKAEVPVIKKTRAQTQRRSCRVVDLILLTFISSLLLTFNRLNIRNANVGANFSRVKRKSEWPESSSRSIHSSQPGVWQRTAELFQGKGEKWPSEKQAMSRCTM